MYQVLAIISSSEKLIFCAINKEAACEISNDKNKSTYTIIYIVVEPNGTRLTINEQRSYLDSLKVIYK